MAMKFAVGGEEGENIFSDVDEDDWFYDAVVNSIQYGWIHGYGDGTFRPNNPITRAEVTAIVNNMLGRAADEDFVDEHTDELTPFSDIEKPLGYYTSSRPPTTTTIPSPPPVRTGRGSTDLLFQNAKNIPRAMPWGYFCHYSFAGKRCSALCTSFLPLRFRTDFPLLV